MFSTLDEYPPPVEPVRIYLGVTVTLTASNFDCPLPAISMPCTDGFLGTSPMECTWIKGTGGGEVRLVGKPMQPTLGNPVTDFLYKFPVTIRLYFPAPLPIISETVRRQVSFRIDNLVYSYGTVGFGSVRTRNILSCGK